MGGEGEGGRRGGEGQEYSYGVKLYAERINGQVSETMVLRKKGY